MFKLGRKEGFELLQHKGMVVCENMHMLITPIWTLHNVNKLNCTQQIANKNFWRHRNSAVLERLENESSIRNFTIELIFWGVGTFKTESHNKHEAFIWELKLAQSML